MSKSIRVNEYYDLFDVAKPVGENPTSYLYSAATAYTKIKPNNEYNKFEGFSNWPDFVDNNKTKANGSNDRVLTNTVEIQGKSKSAHAANTLSIDENGDIWCYPPNVSVPYWSRIIFRNFDYKIQENINALNALVPDTTTYNLNNSVVNLPWSTAINDYLPQYVDVTITETDVSNYWVTPDNETPPAGTIYRFTLWDTNTSIYKAAESGHTAVYPTLFPNKYKDKDFSSLFGSYGQTTISGHTKNYTNSPLFLRFDEYPSRSKVIFSGCDKTRNPDIEHIFGYQKGQMSPIKLSLSLSGTPPVSYYYDENNKGAFNQNLTKEEIISLLNSCYWCIEWIYDKEAGN